MSENGWFESWQVQSESDPSKFYTVSRKTDGTFGCSCPAWTVRRINCKHIKVIASSLSPSGASDATDEIYAKLRFIAKINGITLSCDNCIKFGNGCSCLSNDNNLLFARGEKRIFYVLGRCCFDYEKGKRENV